MYPPIREYGLNKYAEICGAALVTPASGQTLGISEIEIMNRSGSTISLAYGIKIPDVNWEAGFWDESATAAEFLDDTEDAQDAGLDDFPLATVGTDDDGFVFAANKPFNLVGLTVGVVATGSPVYEYTYWDGSAWTALTLIDTPTLTGLGDTYLSFIRPLDWAVGAGSGINASYYAIRVRSTTAPDIAPVLDIAWVVRFLDFAEDVVDNNSLLWTAPQRNSDVLLEGGEAIVPYFGSANAANMVRLYYRLFGEFAS